MGLSIYTILVYCNKEAINLYLFHINLINSYKIRNIIQATKNNIVSEKLAQYENQENVKHFYTALNKKLGLELGNVLASLLHTSQVQTLEDKGWPFLPTITNISLTGMISFFPFLHHIFPQTCL